MLTLEQAIEHCHEKAKELREEVSRCKREFAGFDNKQAIEEFLDNCSDCEECAKDHEQLAAWLTELQERREADEWISVEDRLPDKNGNYLVLLNNGEMTTDIFDEEELFMGFWGYMTHWRPLPKAPESEDKNEER